MWFRDIRFDPLSMISAMRPNVMHGQKQVMRPETHGTISDNQTAQIYKLIEKKFQASACIQVPISSQQSQRPVDHGAGVELTAVTAMACGVAGCGKFSPIVGGFMAVGREHWERFFFKR